LKVLNYVVIVIFVVSLSLVVFNYRSAMSQPFTGVNPMTGMFFPVLVVWSLCLAYFFGFFGISFLDKETLSQSPSSFELNASDDDGNKTYKSVGTDPKESVIDSTTTSVPVETVKPFSISSKSAPTIEHDTPVCSDTGAASATSSLAAATETNYNYEEMSDEEVLSHILCGILKDHMLEKKLGNYERAVHIRRMMYENILEKKLDSIPYVGYDYDKVFGANCEIVVGYVPIPVGIVGPLCMNGEMVGLS